MVEEIKKLTIELNEELIKKYQFSKERLQQLNAKQLNQTLDQIIQFDEIKISLLNELETCSGNMVSSLKRQITDLKLDQLNNFQLNKQEQEKVEELYNKGYKLYSDDKQYVEAIKAFDDALLINNNHLQSLQVKAQCLKMLNNYNEAIIWADKALSIYPKHVDSLYVIARCLYYQSKYKDAIIWADKALSIDSKHISSLQTKGDSLLKIGKYEEALEIFDQALDFNPNNDYNLYRKVLTIIIKI